MTTIEPPVHAAANAPGRVIPVVEQEFEDFETEATAFLKGERDGTAFTKFRLKQGIYGQRQMGRQMVRVKLPFGGVTADQLEALAEVAETFAPLGKGHITTRQNIQYHHVPLYRVGAAMRLLGRAGLSTREACGNVVRNVTGDPWAGVRADEPFDVTPYAGAFVRYWIRNPLSQALPRKFKVTFSGSDRDEGLSGIHDIGFIARVEIVDGRAVRGFRVVAGGGLSTMPKEAILIREFVSIDEYLKVSEAIVRVFNAADELRKNMAKARMKFLVNRVGPDGFRTMVEDELAQGWAHADRFQPDRLLYHDDEAAAAPSLRIEPARIPAEEQSAFIEWSRTAVRRQKQDGYLAIEVQVPQGDLTPEQFRALARIVRTYGNGRARTTQWQNIVLRWIPEGHAYRVWKEVTSIGLAATAAHEITDVVSCPGSDSCKLGITSSMGLNRAISDRVRSMEISDPLTRSMLINISGCPNSCGAHHLGNIGFHGASIKAANDPERQVPSYNVFVGGDRRDGERLRLAQILRVKVPAKRAPDVVERFVRLYETERLDGEEFNQTLDRLGPRAFEDAIRDLTVAPDFSDASVQEFVDWDRQALYVLERGEGECAI